MKPPPIFRTLTLLLAVGPAFAAQIVSTFDGPPGNFAWSLASNWMHNPAAPGLYPKNGMGGNTFDVHINLDRVDLSEDITIDRLGLNVDATGQSAEILLGGRTLTVLQTTTAVGAVVAGGGRLALNTLDITSGLNVLDAGTLASANATTLGIAGSSDGVLRIGGGAEFLNNGTFTILRDGDIATDAGGGTFTHSGTLAKTGGTDISDVSATFNTTAGAVNVSSGTLRFTGASSWMNASAAAGSGGRIILAGNSTLDTVSIALGAGGSFTFNAGTHTLTGTLSGSATDLNGGVVLTGSAKLSGGRLEITSGSRFFLDGGELGTAGVVTNAGDFSWAGGKITGGGLTNLAGEAQPMVIAGIGSASAEITAGTLTNQGAIDHGAKTVFIGNGGVLRNDTNAIYTMSGAAFITPASGATTHSVDNRGIWRKTGSADALINARFASTGPFSVLGGRVFLFGGTDFIGGDILVNGASDPTALLNLSGGMGSLNTLLNGTVVSLAGGGRIEFDDGPHTWQGAIQINGAGGELNGGAVTIASGAAASIQGGGKFVVSSGSIIANATFTSLKDIDWQGGTLSGAGRMISQFVTLRVTSDMRISSGGGGTLENAGTIIVNPAATIRLGLDGLLVNNATRTIQLTGSSAIRKVPAGTQAEIQNSGKLVLTPDASVPSTGNAVVEPDITQTAATAQIVAEQGVLQFTGPHTINAGKVVSTNTGGTGSEVHFSGAGTFGTLAFEFANGGTIQLSSATHTLDGTITLTGAGQLRFTGGTFTAGAGATGSLLIDPAASVVQTNGTLGGSGETIIEDGAYALSGGTTAGLVTSGTGASFTFSNGTLGGTFTNRGAFDWRSGTISGAFTNFATVPPMSITGSVARSLLGGSTLTNRGRINQVTFSSVQIGASATLSNEAGATYDFQGSGTVSSGGSNASFINLGTVLASGAGATANLSAPLTNTGGTIEAFDGTLRISGVATVNGGTFKAATGATLKFEKGTFSGTINHTLSGGTVRYELLAGQPSIVLAGLLASNGTGEVRFASTVDVPGAATLEFIDTAQGKISGTMRMNGGALVNLGHLTSEGGTFLSQSGGTFSNGNATQAGMLTIATASATTLDAVGGGPQFFSNGIIDHTGTGALVFSREAKLRSQVFYQLLGDADLLPGTSPTNHGFINAGAFNKLAGTGTSVVGVPFDNLGSVAVATGTLSFNTGTVAQFDGTHLSGGTWRVSPGATLSLGAGTITENDGTIEISGNGNFTNLPGAGSSTPFQNDGKLHLAGNASRDFGSGAFNNAGTLELDNDATMQVGSLTSSGDVVVNGVIFSAASSDFGFFGTLSGEGVIVHNTTNFGKTKPGKSPGELTIDGAFTQNATGTLGIEIGGLAFGSEYDRLTVTGPVVLGGTLEATILAGAFGLPAGSAFTILTGSSISGTFATLNFPREPGTEIPAFSVQYFPDRVQLTALITLPEPGTASLLAAGALALGFRRRRSARIFSGARASLRHSPRP